MPFQSRFGLDTHGIVNVNNEYWNLPSPAIYEEAIRRREGLMAHLGPLVVRTGHHTGRSAQDKFLVQDPTTESDVWWGKVNVPFEQEAFDDMWRRCVAFMQGRDLYVADLYAGADPKYRLRVRVITQYAWHSLFARNMLIQPPVEDLEDFEPEYVVIDLPQFHAVPDMDGTRSETFVLLNFEKKLVLIGGTSYGGEIKKSVFTIMNYLLPKQGVLPMHCSANVGEKDDVAIFFGLSGTGKTTLSSDAGRRLVGDDEHGWTDDGVFNFEGGCYAKVIHLSESGEPEIYRTTRRFGTILENVAIDSFSRRVDLNDDLLTEDTRASYPMGHLKSIVEERMAGHPTNVIFLTADAFGVLPPISRLTAEQAAYHFISGYTAKVAGTEKGVIEPQATFSSCFGAPFLPMHPSVYADLLSQKIQKHGASVWLVNTGWTGGPHGTGHRMELAHTRSMVRAALAGKLDDVEFETEPVFGLSVPRSCPDVPEETLNPRNTWESGEAYDIKALELAKLFRENFVDYEERTDQAVIDAGPKG
jgi:phosphoenolpyruvate carboxykinase (ATP)